MRLSNLLPRMVFAGVIILVATGCGSGGNTSVEVAANDTDENLEKEITISGSSSTYSIARILIDSYKAKNKAAKIKLLPASQSEGAMAGVKKNILDVGFLSRNIKPQEKDDLIKYNQLAKDALLVATHPSVKGVKNLTTDQIKGIYSGQIENWKQVGGNDAKIVLLDRPEDESAKKLLRRYYLGKELKSSPNAVILRKELELIDSVENIPNSIGAFSLGYAVSNNLPVNRLSLNNIEPSKESITSNKYQMVRQLGLVTAKNPSKETQDFLDFIFSKQGEKTLQKSGLILSKDASR